MINSATSGSAVIITKTDQVFPVLIFILPNNLFLLCFFAWLGQRNCRFPRIFRCANKTGDEGVTSPPNAQQA